VTAIWKEPLQKLEKVKGKKKKKKLLGLFCNNLVGGHSFFYPYMAIIYDDL
jgi:hypothetical protein